jgi:hypothetical protein
MSSRVGPQHLQPVEAMRALLGPGGEAVEHRLRIRTADGHDIVRQVHRTRNHRANLVRGHAFGQPELNHRVGPEPGPDLVHAADGDELAGP